MKAEKILEGIVNLLLTAYFVMLLIGAAHHEISPSIPAIGYFGTLVGLVLVGFVGTAIRGNKS